MIEEYIAKKEILSLESEIDNTLLSIYAVPIGPVFDTVSIEATVSSIIETIADLVWKVIVNIGKLLKYIFTTDAGNLDRNINKLQRKSSDLILKSDEWAKHAVNTTSDGLSLIAKNLMLFKLISDDKLNYLEWLVDTDHINISADATQSYDEIHTVLSAEHRDRYNKFYYEVSNRFQFTNKYNPKVGEILIPTTISGNTITFTILTINSEHTKLKVSKPKTISVILNYEVHMDSIKNVDLLHELIVNVIKKISYIDRLKPVIKKEGITKSDISDTISRLLILTSSNPDDDSNIKEAGKFLSHLTTTSSQVLKGHMNSVSIIAGILNEILRYKD